MDAPNYAGNGTWEEESIATDTSTDDKLLADAKTVHNIIYSNIAEDSDAYTWIKSRLAYRDVRFNMVYLRRHFSGDVVDQVLGGQVTVNLIIHFTVVSAKLFLKSSSTNLPTPLITRRDLLGP